MRRAAVVLCALLATHRLAAQTPDEYYYPYAEPEERTEVLLTDSVLFYRAVQRPVDRYGELTAFNLPQVALHRRSGRYADTQYEHLDIHYRYLTALRRLGATEELQPDSRRIAFSEDEPLQPRQAAVWFTDRRYLFGARIAAQEQFGRGWQGAAVAEMRTGRDLHVEGVFTQAVTAGLRMAKRWRSDAVFSVILIVPPTVRGTQLASTEEAFTLTGDRSYNPAWGFQNGRVRNSRVRRECVPTAVAVFTMPISAQTSLRAAANTEIGLRKYSMLNWYDARTPMPDNYRYLPSYTGDRETEQAWRAADARFTQIDWDELIRQNHMAAGEAVYALEDRVERTTNGAFDLNLTTQFDDQLTLRYGAFVRYDRSRNYKQMRDLLGADRVTDIDQYLIDDATYRTMRQNDVRHPDRTIREGDRFGYDYALTRMSAGVRAEAEYRADRLRLDLSAEFGAATISRRGYYEKELFRGAQSYGRSRRMRFSPYRLEALAGWAFSPRRYLALSVLAAAEAPDAADLFYQPQYNNRALDNLTPEHRYSISAAYRQTGTFADLYLTAYAEAAFDGVQTVRYYDDMAALFCDMAVTGIGCAAYGVEAAADLHLSYRWQLSVAASAGDSRFVRDPQVTVLSDVDNTVVDSRATARLGGCRTGGVPQFTACVSTAYFGARGWGGRLSAGYTGGRYVEAAPLRRTDRIAGQAALTPAAFAEFTQQERLADAFTLDVSFFKTFVFEHSRLTASLMLRNLTGGDTIYSGYESLRVRRLTAGDAVYYVPHATRYTYAYSRSFYVTIGYKF